jgi:hypothetical protein
MCKYYSKLLRTRFFAKSYCEIFQTLLRKVKDCGKGFRRIDITTKL